MRVRGASRFTAGCPRHHGTAVRGGTRILAARDHPVAAALLQMVLHRHTLRRVPTLGGERYGGLGLIPIHLDGGHIHIHPRDIHPNLGKVIDDALADGVPAVATIAGGQQGNQRENQADSHNLIITVECEGRPEPATRTVQDSPDSGWRVLRIICLSALLAGWRFTS